MILDDVFACSVNDAQCVRINSYCICHCLPGYILEDKKCLKSELAFFLKNNTMKYREYTGFSYKKNGVKYHNDKRHIFLGNANIYNTLK